MKTNNHRAGHKTGHRVVLIGDFIGTPDEGMKNVSATLYNRLAKNNRIIFMNPGQALSVYTLIRLRMFNPAIIHYLHGPTIRSLIILAFLKIVTGAKTVVSATRPYLPAWTRILFPLVTPDLVLTQSGDFEAFCRSKGTRVSFFPNGVDRTKFSPRPPGDKAGLRQKLNLPRHKKIILHVGHIKPNRQLDVFFQIQGMEGIQVVVAGGTHEAADEALKERLVRAGIIVVHEYMPDISELYNAADLYLFPIVDKGRRKGAGYNSLGAIDLPLSVLEAMSCDLPVLTTPFGALPRLFSQGDGYIYADSHKGLIEKLRPMLESGKTGTRQKVAPLAWSKIVRYLEQHYEGLVRIKEKKSFRIHPGMPGKESVR